MRLALKAKSVIAATFASLLLGSTALHAEPATPEGADRVKAALQTYFTARKGVVTVAPEGETYRVILDFRHIAPQNPLNVVEITPLAIDVKPLGNGHWQVSEHQKNLRIHITSPESVLNASIGTLDFDGTFDEALQAFSESALGATNFTIVQSANQQIPANGSGPARMLTSEVQRRSGNIMIKTSATGSADAVDIHLDYIVTDSAAGANMLFPVPGQSPLAIKYSVKTENAHVIADIAGLNARGVNDLVAFFANRPGDSPIAANQDQLRQKLTAALPVFKSITVKNNSGKQDIEIEVAGTNTRLTTGESEGSATLSGLTPSGNANVAATIKNITVTSDAWGDWVTPLIPTEITFGVTLSGFDLEAGAKLAISKFDLTTPGPFDHAFGFPQQLIRAMLPAASIALALDNISLTAPAGTFSLGGKVTVHNMAFPDGTGSASLTGYDAIMAALAKGPQTQAMVSTTGALALVRSYAKIGADGKTLVWNMAASGTRGFTVNDRVVVPPMSARVAPPATPTSP